MSQFKKDLIASFVFLIFGAFVLISVPLTIDDPVVSVMGPRSSPISSEPAWYSSVWPCWPLPWSSIARP